MAYGALKQQELIELVRSHHPHMLEEEVRRALNRAQADFSAQTEVLEAVFGDTLVTDQRFYRLGASNNQADHPIIRIKRVDIMGEHIPRFTGLPPTTDKDVVS